MEEREEAQEPRPAVQRVEDDDVFERTVEAAIAFTQRFVRTTWLLVRRPTQAPRLLLDDLAAGSHRYSRPSGFLLLWSLLAAGSVLLAVDIGKAVAGSMLPVESLADTLQGSGMETDALALLVAVPLAALGIKSIDWAVAREERRFGGALPGLRPLGAWVAGYQAAWAVPLFGLVGLTITSMAILLQAKDIDAVVTVLLLGFASLGLVALAQTVLSRRLNRAVVSVEPRITAPERTKHRVLFYTFGSGALYPMYLLMALYAFLTARAVAGIAHDRSRSPVSLQVFPRVDDDPTDLRLALTGVGEKPTVLTGWRVLWVGADASPDLCGQLDAGGALALPVPGVELVAPTVTEGQSLDWVELTPGESVWLRATVPTPQDWDPDAHEQHHCMQLAGAEGWHQPG